MTAPGRPFDPFDEALLHRAGQLQQQWERSRPDHAGIAALHAELVAAASGRPVMDYLREFVNTADVSSPPGGAVLWSYHHPTGAGTPEGISSQHVMDAWVERHNAANPDQPVNTIHTIEAGQLLDRVWITDFRMIEALDITRHEALDLWRRVAERYVQQATGDVRVFADIAHTDAILWDTELPAARRNPAVGPNRVHFLYPPPVEADLRATLEPPGVRSRIQADNPALPGYLDLDRLRQLDGGRRADYVATVCAAVDLEDAADLDPGRPIGPMHGPRPGQLNRDVDRDTLKTLAARIAATAAAAEQLRDQLQHDGVRFYGNNPGSAEIGTDPRRAVDNNAVEETDPAPPDRGPHL